MDLNIIVTVIINIIVIIVLIIIFIRERICQSRQTQVPSGAIMTECEKEVTLTHTSTHARANPRERPIWEQAHWEQAHVAHGPYGLMAGP